jgi:hypothetical protein
MKRELRESMVTNTAREYIKMYRQKLQAYNSIFKAAYNESDYVIMSFADYLAMRINLKMDTRLQGCEILDWYFVERQKHPVTQPCTITIGQMSALTFAGLSLWLRSDNNTDII